MIHKYICVESLYSNVEEIKRLLNGKLTCAMVKANAYGHGIEAIVGRLCGVVDWFGVATCEEAFRAREVDKKTPIILVGECGEDYVDELITQNISIAIHSISQYEMIENKLQKNRCKKPLKIHVKINTGMNRLGISTIHEFNYLQKKIKNNKRFFFEGIFTHYSTINCDKKYFYQQNKLFLLFIKNIYKCFNPIIHGGGSSLINKGNNDVFDMIRIGIYLYGYCEKNENLQLKPILKIKSKIIAIQNVKINQKIGYGNDFIAEKKMQIAVIFLGYFDGINRKLKNVAKVKIHGQLFSVVGNICMDMFMVDISDAKQKVIAGDEVVVFDDANYWANICDTIPYEILTGFSNCR